MTTTIPTATPSTGRAIAPPVSADPATRILWWAWRLVRQVSLLAFTTSLWLFAFTKPHPGSFADTLTSLLPVFFVAYVASYFANHRMWRHMDDRLARIPRRRLSVHWPTQGALALIEGLGLYVTLRFVTAQPHFSDTVGATLPPAALGSALAALMFAPTIGLVFVSISDWTPLRPDAWAICATIKYVALWVLLGRSITDWTGVGVLIAVIGGLVIGAVACTRAWDYMMGVRVVDTSTPHGVAMPKREPHSSQIVNRPLGAYGPPWAFMERHDGLTLAQWRNHVENSPRPSLLTAQTALSAVLFFTISGFIVGLGPTWDDVDLTRAALTALACAGVALVGVGAAFLWKRYATRSGE